jgi:thiosulfate/3-mercaptopyruvate sulfurtransferase
MASRDFCTTDELAAELGDPDLGVIDGSWHLPNTGRFGAVEFRLGHIPGAVYFDIDTIADLDSSLPHMLPKPDLLAKEMTALGLGDGMRFVVYDVLGLYAAARVWWTLRAYGVQDVRILEGGLTKWIAEGRPLESGEARPTPRRSPRGSTKPSSPRSRRCARRWRQGLRGWWTQGPPTGSAARRPSPAPVSRAATCPAA